MSACPLCAAQSGRQVVVGYDRMRATSQDYPYVACGACGLVHQAELPTQEEIPGFYPGDYTPHAGGTARSPSDKSINRFVIRHRYGADRSRSTALGRFLAALMSPWVLRGTQPPRGECRLLDVGCGGGSLLGKYRDLGWSVKGVELDAKACEAARARGLEVHHGMIFDAPYDTGSFDMIVLGHVIEHVLDPAGFLRRCAEYLAPGGLLVLATPNARALGFQLYGTCWYPLDAPRHLMLFDPDTIRSLADQAGLRAVRVKTLPEVRHLCTSRHYERSQGRELPKDLDERRTIVERSTTNPETFELYKNLMRPVAAVTSTFGRGEVLEAELVRS